MPDRRGPRVRSVRGEGVNDPDEPADQQRPPVADAVARILAFECLWMRDLGPDHDATPDHCEDCAAAYDTGSMRQRRGIVPREELCGFCGSYHMAPWDDQCGMLGDHNRVSFCAYCQSTDHSRAACPNEMLRCFDCERVHPRPWHDACEQTETHCLTCGDIHGRPWNGACTRSIRCLICRTSHARPACVWCMPCDRPHRPPVHHGPPPADVSDPGGHVRRDGRGDGDGDGDGDESHHPECSDYFCTGECLLRSEDDCDCLSCRSLRRRGDGLIMSWDYRPHRFRFHGEPPRFLGMELELELGDGYDHAASIAYDALVPTGAGYLKEDGSLSEGFEIVSHPMSYTWAMEQFPWELLADLRERGARSPEGAGLHVHVSRAAFASPSHSYRWLQFLYRSQRQVEGIARRRSSNWARFADSDREAFKYLAKGEMGPNHRPGRYAAVNLTNPATLEVRVFRSTTRPVRALAALGLVDSTVEYAQQISAADITHSRAWEWGAYVNWLRVDSERADMYSALNREIGRVL